MKTKYLVSQGILFMNPYGKNGPWLPVTKLDERAIEMIETTERKVEQEREDRRSVKSKLGYSRIGLGNV